MLTQPDPLTISASFITKQVQLAKKDGGFQLHLELLSRRQEYAISISENFLCFFFNDYVFRSVLANLSVRGANGAETHQVISPGKAAKFELANVELDAKTTESHFQEIVLHVYSDPRKQKLLDVHREFVMPT